MGKKIIYAKYLKRAIDFCLSSLALVVFSPLLFALAVVGAFAMKGNPFFVQRRPGMKDKRTGNERIILIIKYRTMTNKKDRNGVLLPDEHRLNSYGKFLRSTSLDELISLINIVKGDLAIVGPRPLLEAYLPRYSAEQRRRHEVRPGLTGYAQAYGRNSLSWQEKFAKDVFYVDHVSFGLDMKVLLRTIISVVKREGINSKTSATMEEFAGNVVRE